MALILRTLFKQTRLLTHVIYPYPCPCFGRFIQYALLSYISVPDA